MIFQFLIRYDSQGLIPGYLVEDHKAGVSRGKSDESSAIRLFEGLRLLRAWPQARLIVSGASWRGDLEPVAFGYARAARELGVPEERITILDTPVDTAQEAYAVRAALGTEPRFVLVTSAAHIPRAMRHFQRVGLDPIPAPT